VKGDNQELTYLIGIDEVGRGPLAGPVAVAALQFKIKNYQSRIEKTELPLRDSKKLTKIQREKWFKQINNWCEEGICRYAVSMIAPGFIDKHGISHALRSAVSESLAKIKATDSQSILLDGSLKAPKEFTNQTTIIKGDEKEILIALASIAAKVLRDRKMVAYGKQHPQYLFEQHKGYGTREHMFRIKKYGALLIHRKSFLKGLTP